MREKFAADPLTVTELVGRIRSILREQLGRISVEGELSNVSRPTSGHCYFTLKDENAQIRCVMFRSDLQRLAFGPQDGMQVVVTGYSDVYQSRGTLQIRALTMVAAGEGALQKAFEALKTKLMKEGLFDAARKKSLPRFPRRIAIVTSPTGAAIQDLLQILGRRYPVVEVVMCPVQVQGASAALEIARTITAINQLSDHKDELRVDVIIVGRGGGSAEDLWAFNEEVVARAIYGSKIPVVSAVGHETDFSISDFVADARAPTPSAAAEVVVPDRLELGRYVGLMARKMINSVNGAVTRRRQEIMLMMRSHGMRRPLERVEQLNLMVDDLSSRITQSSLSKIRRTRDSVEALARQLEALNPNGIMQRGYARIERDGQSIIKASQLVDDDVVSIRFSDGGRNARILGS